jgi:hypothetical protein
MPVGRTCPSCDGENSRSARYCQWCSEQLRDLEDFETPRKSLDGPPTVERRTGTSLRCRIGWHDWSTNHGGIKVCRRADCRKAKPYGIFGVMREVDFEEDLYETFQSYEASLESDENKSMEGSE